MRIVKARRFRSRATWRAVYPAPRLGGALIDEQLPRYDFRDAYHAVVLAPPADVYCAMMALDFLRLPTVRILFALRELPERLWRWVGGREQSAATSHATLDDLVRVGAFTMLAERPGRELVLGAVGCPWRLDYGGIRIAPEEFAQFATPGFAKVAWSWTVKPLGSGQSLLVVEWRTALTDGAARARFRRYWAVVGSGVRLIARVSLARIKADCERPAPLTYQPARPSVRQRH
jgi:hypothetical protein